MKTAAQDLDGFRTIDQVVYINLAARTDRRETLECEFRRIGVPTDKITRVEAMYNRERPDVGCATSHENALVLAATRGWCRVLLLEDDFCFLGDRGQVQRRLATACETLAISAAAGHPVDLLMLSADTTTLLVAPHVLECWQGLALQIVQAQGAAGYLVERTGIAPLRACLRQATPALLHTHMHWLFANDQAWKSLQTVGDRWLVMDPPLGRQLSGFSDLAVAFRAHPGGDVALPRVGSLVSWVFDNELGGFLVEGADPTLWPLAVHQAIDGLCDALSSSSLLSTATGATGATFRNISPGTPFSKQTRPIWPLTVGLVRLAAHVEVTLRSLARRIERVAVARSFQKNDEPPPKNGRGDDEGRTTPRQIILGPSVQAPESRGPSPAVLGLAAPLLWHPGLAAQVPAEDARQCGQPLRWVMLLVERAGYITLSHKGCWLIAVRKEIFKLVGISVPDPVAVAQHAWELATPHDHALAIARRLAHPTLARLEQLWKELGPLPLSHCSLRNIATKPP